MFALIYTFAAKRTAMQERHEIFHTGEICLIHNPDWWKCHLREYLYIYCECGAARLMLLSREYELRQGGFIIISPDMFPSQLASSEDFKIAYCVFDNGLADRSTYDVPKEFFDCMYARPVMSGLEGVETWMRLFRQVDGNGNTPYRREMAADLLHAFTLHYYSQWRKAFGDTPRHYERSNADALCIAFYNLMLEHCRAHHGIAFYAEKLCITPNYLAMIMRRQCGESPKMAIDRQLMLDLEYQLRNTTLTVSDLAREFHFPDTSYLCRYFRRHAGMSLTEYRTRTVPRTGAWHMSVCTP